MDEFVRRRITVSIENDQIGEGLFAPIVAATLRELADMIERDEAGRGEREVYLRDGGTLAVVTSEDLTAVCIPYRKPGEQRLLARHVQDAA